MVSFSYADGEGGLNNVSIRWLRVDALDAFTFKQKWASFRCGRRSFGQDANFSFRLMDVDSCSDCPTTGIAWGHSMFGSLSSIFSRGKRETRHKQNLSPSGTSMIAFSPTRGTYAYDALQRRFKELDKDGVGYITEGELKVALKKLNLPASEHDVQGFMTQVVDTTKTSKVTFEQFAEYAINRENYLLDTFKELDKRKTGYITVEELKAALKKYKFRISDEDVMKVVNKMHIRGGLLGSPDSYNHNQAFDFADFRDFMMFSTAKDLRNDFQIWGRAVIDLGDIDVNFPLSSGRYDKASRLVQRRPKPQVLKHLVAAAMSSVFSRTVVAPLERIKVLSMVDPAVASLGFATIFNKIWRDEGIKGLFKGNLLHVARISPTKAVEFFIYDNIKDFVLKKTKRADITGVECMVLGAVASMAGAFVTYPIDTVRSIVTVQASGAQQGIVEVTRSILQNEPFSGFYQGIIPNMLRVVPYGAINFFVYDQLKELHRKKVGPGGDLGVMPAILFGAIAGASAQTAVYPLETVQRRLQIQACHQGQIFYKNWLHAFEVIIREEGAGALYAGTVHFRWTFLFERFMKVLKSFARQSARLAGSVIDVWLVQDSLIYITEFLVQLNPDMPVVWSDSIDDRVVGEQLQGNGKVKRMNQSMREKVSTFCIYNSKE